jgi:hypothetical protein
MASSSHLKPGEKGAITVKASTAGKSGPLTETAEVVTNDPKRPKVVLTLQATVVDFLPATEAPVCK